MKIRVCLLEIQKLTDKVKYQRDKYTEQEIEVFKAKLEERSERLARAYVFAIKERTWVQVKAAMRKAFTKSGLSIKGDMMSPLDPTCWEA